MQFIALTLVVCFFATLIPSGLIASAYSNTDSSGQSLSANNYPSGNPSAFIPDTNESENSDEYILFEDETKV